MHPPPLHGRDRLLASIRESLPARLTLVGPGGVGKTRLAEALLGAGSFVALAQSRTADEAVRAMALELGMDGDRIDRALEAASPHVHRARQL